MTGGILLIIGAAIVALGIVLNTRNVPVDPEKQYRDYALAPTENEYCGSYEDVYKPNA